MEKTGKILFWLLLVGSLTIMQAKAQKVDAFVRVSISPSQVVVKQPIKVKATVLTATWFTEPLDFQNVQVPNAFILPFARTQSGIHHVNGKQYAGLEFFFLVFPYAEGEYIFPALEIKTATPAENDYKGVPVTLHSKARNFKVNKVPGGSTAPSLVAKHLYLSEEWSKDLSTVRVGDVVTRTIYLNAKGTLPSFIPSLDMKDLAFASIYSKKEILEDRRDDRDANGLRIERYSYLFEKEGQFIIPPTSASWWNPYIKRKYEKSLKAIDIVVAPNPDLGLVSSVRDSLNNLTKQAQIEQETKTWRDYMPQLIQVGSSLLVVLFIIWVAVRIYRYWHARRVKYLSSETYYFDQFKKKKSLKSLYRWYDEYRKGTEMTPDVRSIFPEANLDNKDLNPLVSEVSAFRREKRTRREESYTLNP